MNKISLLIIALCFSAPAAYATNKKPPKPPTEPPITMTVEQQQAQAQGQAQKQGQGQAQSSKSHSKSGSTSDSSSDSASNSSSDSASNSSSDSVSAASADGGSSDNAVAVSNVYMSRAFAQDFPVTHGCFVGVNGGGDKTTQAKSTGGFLGFTYLSNSCHMQALANAEKDVELVSRLRCGDRKYRNAVAFDHPKGITKREHCIDKVRGSLVGAIEIEKQKLQELASKYKDERDTAVILYEEQSNYADKLRDEVAEKRLVEAVSK